MFVLLSVIDEAKLAKSPGSSLATIFICAVKNFPEDSPQFTGKHCSGFFLKDYFIDIFTNNLKRL